VGWLIIIAVTLDQWIRKVASCAAMDITADATPAPASQLVLEARGLVKHYGRVVALDHADFELRRTRSWASSATTALASPR